MCIFNSLKPYNKMSSTQNKACSVMLTTAEDQETSKLVAFNLEKTNRRLVGQVLGGPLSVPWGRVLSLVYVPGHPCSVIQTRDKLYFVYLQ